VKKGDNLSRLVQDVYGYSNREVLDRVKRQNRGIKDVNRIEPGKKIVFPTMEE
jgi:hypothetical protein